MTDIFLLLIWMGQAKYTTHNDIEIILLHLISTLTFFILIRILITQKEKRNPHFRFIFQILIISTSTNV